MTKLPNKYPRDPEIFSDMKEFIKKYLIGNFSNHEKFINSESKIFSQGSCFAGNITRSLRENGFNNCSHLDISENFNNTFANKEIIKILTSNYLSEKQLSWISEIIRGDDIKTNQYNLKNSNIIILTFGVSLILVDRESKIIQNKLNKTSTLIMSNVSDNSENIKNIINSIKNFNPESKIIVTVSPIPLESTSRNRNAIIDDCISKSIIRSSVDLALQDLSPDIIYWPSFEIIRSMNIHYPPSFGASKKHSNWQGDPRHPNRNLVNLTMELFLETFCEY